MTVWYPVMLNMEGKHCLVYGGGAVAERKIGGLLEAGALVLVISPKLTEGLLQLVECGRVTWQQRSVGQEELPIAAADFVIAATADSRINRLVAAAARSAGVPVHLTDDGESGDFLLPAVVRRGRFVLTASTSGAGPAFAARIARQLAHQYGPEYESYTDMLQNIRRIVKSQVADAAQRRKLLIAAAEEAFLRERLSEGETGDPQRLITDLQRRADAMHDGEEP